jgi:hypothetical protein
LIAVRLGDDLELTEMFDVNNVNQWIPQLGPDVQQLWERIKKSARYDG